MIAVEAVPVTTVSQNGQVVIPDGIRKALNIFAGIKFAVFARNDTIILKKLDVPSAEQAFKELNDWGVKHAKANGLKEENVMKKIYRRRGVKHDEGSP